MPHDVFISHSTKDKIAADAVVAHLERDGLRCWCAPRDILPGSSWATSIVRGITDCKVMVVVFSANANKSDHIRREVERAVGHGIPVVPVRIEDVMPQGDLEYFLSSSHWMDAITPPVEKHFDELATRLRSLLQLSPRPADESTQLPAAGALNAGHKSRSLPVAIAIAVLCLAVGLYLAIHHLHRSSSGNLAHATSAPANSPGTDSLASDNREWQRLALITWGNSFFIDHAPKRYSAWLDAAEKGDPTAQFFIGCCYAEGITVPQNPKTAFEWLMKSAQQHNSDAMSAVADSFSGGDNSQAYRWARDAADLGNPHAMVRLSSMYEAPFLSDRHEVVPADDKAVFEWANKAANLGSGDAMCALTVRFLQSNLSKFVDAHAQQQWLSKAASIGNPEAVFWSYLYRVGLERAVASIIEKGATRLAPTEEETNLARKAIAIGNPAAVAMLASVDPNDALKRLRQMANLGSCDASYQLGKLYQNGGESVAKDSAEALRWYLKASDGGSHDAMFELGNMYAKGEGVEQDALIALSWWEKSGHDLDAECIGDAFAAPGKNRNMKTAIEWWSKSHHTGFMASDSSAYRKIAEAYIAGDGVDKNPDEAIKWWKKSGDDVRIGDIYATGDGVPVDADAAIQWWTTAANGYSPDAECRLANAYWEGKLVPKDAAKAAAWYQKAADHGSALALWWLGSFYRDGTGVEENDTQAVQLFIQASTASGTDDQQAGAVKSAAELIRQGRSIYADQSLADHLENLAAHMKDGAAEQMVADDLKRLAAEHAGSVSDFLIQSAFKYYSAAANAGIPAAMRELAKLYDNGQGTSKSADLAKQYWTKAADAGDAEAMSHLGRAK